MRDPMVFAPYLLQLRPELFIPVLSQTHAKTEKTMNQKLRSLLGVVTATALLLGTVAISVAAPPSHAGGPPPHVCENNPGHQSCVTTTTDSTTTTTEATTTTTESTTTTTTQSTTTTTDPSLSHVPYAVCIDGDPWLYVDYLPPGTTLYADIGGDQDFNDATDDQVTPTNPVEIFTPVEWREVSYTAWELRDGTTVLDSGQVDMPDCSGTATTTTTEASTTTSTSTSTTTSPSTTTTTPDPTRTLLWTGNQVSDWYSTANSGGGDQWDTNPGVEQYNPALDGSTNHGARLNHQGFGSSRVLPTEAYYSVEILVPSYQGAQNNVFQFKQGRNGIDRVHLWNIGWRPVNGELVGLIRTRLDGDQWANSNLQDPNAWLNWTVPIGEWFHVEVFRRISTGSDGRYEVRIDGVLVYTFDGPTAASNLEPRPTGNHEWVLSHYLGRGYYTTGSIGPTSVFFRNAKIEE